MSETITNRLHYSHNDFHIVIIVIMRGSVADNIEFIMTVVILKTKKQKIGPPAATVISDFKRNHG